MLVSFRTGLIAFATPKAASTTMHRSLDRDCDIVFSATVWKKHLTVASYVSELHAPLEDANGFEDFVAVAIVRQPIDWLWSWYRFKQRPTQLAPEPTKDVPFAEFVANVITDEQSPWFEVRRQSPYLHHDGRRHDVLVPFDDVAGTLQQVVDAYPRVGVQLSSVDWSHRANVSPEMDIAAKSLPPDLHTAALQHFERDLELYEAACSNPVVRRAKPATYDFAALTKAFRTELPLDAAESDLNRARHELRLGNVLLAQELVDRSLQARPESTKAMHTNAKVLQRLGDLPGAIAWATKASELSDSPVIHRHLQRLGRAPMS